MLLYGLSYAIHVLPGRVFGAALENENENDNEPFGLAIADGEFRHCSTATTRQRRM